MIRLLLRNYAVTGLMLSLVGLSTAPAFCSDHQEREQQLRKCQDAISSLNLLNGLHLTDKQLKELLALNEELKNAQDAVINDKQTVSLQRNAGKNLQKLYQYLISNPEKEDADIQNQASKANRDYREYLRKRMQNSEKAMKSIVDRAEKVLSDEQLQVVETFKSCIVPPKDMRDPVRAGQAAQSTYAEKALQRIRKLKDKKDVDRAAHHAADRYVDVTNKHFYKMTDDEIKRKHREIIKIIKKAHSLSDTEFELKKDDIAAQLEPDKNKIKKMYQEVNERNPHTKPLNRIKQQNIVRFLLKPEIMIPILEKRLKASKTGGLR